MPPNKSARLDQLEAGADLRLPITARTGLWHGARQYYLVFNGVSFLDPAHDHEQRLTQHHEKVFQIVTGVHEQ